MKYHLVYLWFVFPTLITISYFSSQGKEIRFFLFGYTVATVVSQALLSVIEEKALDNKINRMAEGKYNKTTNPK